MFLQPDVAVPLQPPDMLNGSPHKASLSLMHNALHEEIDQFCKQVFSLTSCLLHHHNFHECALSIINRYSDA